MTLLVWVLRCVPVARRAIRPVATGAAAARRVIHRASRAALATKASGWVAGGTGLVCVAVPLVLLLPRQPALPRPSLPPVVVLGTTPGGYLLEPGDFAYGFGSGPLGSAWVGRDGRDLPGRLAVAERFTAAPQAVPEPWSIVLLISALGLLLACRLPCIQRHMPKGNEFYGDDDVPKDDKE